MPGQAGQVVGRRYLLVEPVGQGGMGRVWRARDQVLDRVVAVKELLLPPQVPDRHAELVARMLREGRAAARLSHPGVVTVHDVFEHDGTPWLVMQFIPGRSLKEEIARCGRLPWPRAADIGAQVADALAHAHAAGIVHRDLKPDNILLSGSQAVVTDFGIARIVGATRLTGSGMAIGTAHYMAPEQVEGGDVGAPADLWALGVTLHTAVQGTPPFDGPSLMAIMSAILTQRPPVPEHAGPLREVLGALLAKDPAERPDAQAVTRALARQASQTAANDRVVPVLPAQSVAVTPPPPSGGPLPQPRRRRFGWPAWAAAGSVVAVAGVVLALTLPGAGQRSPGSSGTGTSTTGPSASAAATTGRSATGSPGPGTAALPPLHSGKPVLARTVTVPKGAGVSYAQLSPDGKVLIADDITSDVYVWNALTGRFLGKLGTPAQTVTTSFAFGPDDATLLAVSEGMGAKNIGTEKLYRWNLTTMKGTLVRSLPSGGKWTLSGDDSVLAAESGSTITVTNVSTGSVIRKIVLPGVPQTGIGFYLALDGDGGEVLAENKAGTAYVWDTTTGRLLSHVPYTNNIGAGTAGLVIAPNLSPDGKTIVVPANSGTPKPPQLWDVATGANITPDDPRWSRNDLTCKFSDDGRICATDEAGGKTVDLWDIATHKLLEQITDPGGVADGGVSSVSSDGGTVAVLGPVNANFSSVQIYLWDIPPRG